MVDYDWKFFLGPQTGATGGKDVFFCEMLYGITKPENATDFEFKLRFNDFWDGEGTKGWLLDTKPLTTTDILWWDRAPGNVKCPTDAANWEFGVESNGIPSHTACKVQGILPIWGEWTEWRACTGPCGSQNRQRTCTQGDCPGSASQSRNCNTGDCRKF